jgi:1-acyl-sn-glycerol-3-phosphate acyltransferase
MRRLKLIYLNVTFYVFFFIFSLVAIPTLSVFVTLCVLILPRRQALRRLRRAISWYGAVIIRILPFPLVRLKHKDYYQADPGGPYIFVCNHRSASDPFLMAVLTGELIQIVNVWPFRVPVLGFIAKLAGYLSVREMPFEDFKARTTKLLREGVSIIVFPEGTRSRDNSVGQFNGAIFRIALETRKPIVPLCITGNELIPPIGSGLLHPGVIRIHRLKSICWEEYGALGPFKLKNYIRQIIIDEVAAMERCT